MGNLFAGAPEGEVELRVLFIGTGKQRHLCAALQQCQWPGPEVDLSNADSRGQIEVPSRKRTLSTLVLDRAAQSRWHEHYETSDAIVFVLDEADGRALNKFTDVIRNPGSYDAKAILVAISTGPNVKGGVIDVLNRDDDTLTSKKMIFVNPVSGRGLEEVLSRVCSAYRRAAPVASEAREAPITTPVASEETQGQLQDEAEP
mmetsp:Transcript_69598/g.115256  ORF Transcript_69598/g.115256 Transcript_69598/m.115256 type:complete len:202 (+) Transcript_69598:71-676(+)